jgi:hypothetical protein
VCEKIYILGGVVYMDYVHQIIESSKLINIFDLPASLKGKSVEVIILPVPDLRQKTNTRQKTSFGCLKEYANIALFTEEKGAWEKAVMAKYANS